MVIIMTIGRPTWSPFSNPWIARLEKQSSMDEIHLQSKLVMIHNQ